MSVESALLYGGVSDHYSYGLTLPLSMEERATDSIKRAKDRNPFLRRSSTHTAALPYRYIMASGATSANFIFRFDIFLA